MKPITGRDIRLGIIGYGARGKGQLRLLMEMEGVEVVSVCDILPFRVKEAQDAVKAITGRDIAGYDDYRDLIARSGVDAVMIFSSWQTHMRIAVCAMKAGVYAATEVSGATSVQECWHLVQTYEDTGVPCMMLENCNYSRQALALLRMVKEDVFGELIHCTGAYQHDLRDEIGLGREINHYRFEHFVNRNAELYPTHEIGPLAKLLNINRGNRFLTLVSMSSKARGLEKWYRDDRKAWNPWVTAELERSHKGPLPADDPEYDMIGRHIACGDVVTTMIKCAGGETVTIVHDCTLARARLNNARVQGTKALYMGDPDLFYVEHSSPWDKWESAGPWFDKYDHPLWLSMQEARAKEAYGHGHGGIDYMVMMAFLDAVRGGKQTPIDVYDTAAWRAITALSEESIALGSQPVAFPDFTNGAWMKREPLPPGRYNLDRVCWDCFA
jgi:hypothetical protein